MPRFLCDVMLGSLARWLRLLGYDCAYHNDAGDLELAEEARREGRWLLTRDRRLAAVGPRTQLVEAAGLDEQLAEVLARHRQEPCLELAGARCAECNGELAPATRAAAAGRVPPHVLATAPSLRVCAGCGRFYWPGSHARRIEERLRRVAAAVRARGGLEL